MAIVATARPRGTSEPIAGSEPQTSLGTARARTGKEKMEAKTATEVKERDKVSGRIREKARGKVDGR